MATTPNYGFIMPNPTDLVTDLPADFEIFGDEVDLRVKALNPETTEGDLAYRGATADAKDRLGIGTAGQVLAVNAGADAPEWVTPAGAAGSSFTLLNPGGTSLSGTNTTISGISGINTIHILVQEASTGTANNEIAVRFNTDTTDNYAFSAWQGTDTTNEHTSSTGTNADKIKLGRMGNSAANVVSGGLILYGANTTTPKPLIAIGAGTGTTRRMFATFGFYNGVTTISSITINGDGGTFDAGTVFVFGSAI